MNIWNTQPSLAQLSSLNLKLSSYSLKHCESNLPCYDSAFQKSYVEEADLAVADSLFIDTLFDEAEPAEDVNHFAYNQEALPPPPGKVIDLEDGEVRDAGLLVDLRGTTSPFKVVGLMWKESQFYLRVRKMRILSKAFCVMVDAKSDKNAGFVCRSDQSYFLPTQRAELMKHVFNIVFQNAGISPFVAGSDGMFGSAEECDFLIPFPIVYGIAPYTSLSSSCANSVFILAEKEQKLWLCRADIHDSIGSHMSIQIQVQKEVGEGGQDVKLLQSKQFILVLSQNKLKVFNQSCEQVADYECNPSRLQTAFVNDETLIYEEDEYIRVLNLDNQKEEEQIQDVTQTETLEQDLVLIFKYQFNIFLGK